MCVYQFLEMQVDLNPIEFVHPPHSESLGELEPNVLQI